mmetsp:Transcript_18374/g.52660  ORF Transcript_18374/g.52660 Transcript_18374/m.52660 type:complete len:215 (-) Transcript_18374:191-835(-)
MNQGGAPPPPPPPPLPSSPRPASPGGRTPTSSPSTPRTGPGPSGGATRFRTSPSRSRRARTSSSGWGSILWRPLPPGPRKTPRPRRRAGRRRAAAAARRRLPILPPTTAIPQPARPNRRRTPSSPPSSTAGPAPFIATATTTAWSGCASPTTASTPTDLWRPSTRRPTPTAFTTSSRRPSIGISSAVVIPSFSILPLIGRATRRSPLAVRPSSR